MKCSMCKDPKCPGEEELRQFKDWTDLAAHLSEETIVRLINHLSIIGPEYERLKDQNDTRKLKHKTYQETQKQLRKAARQFLSRDEVEAIRKNAEQMALKRLEESE